MIHGAAPLRVIVRSHPDRHKLSDREIRAEVDAELAERRRIATALGLERGLLVTRTGTVYVNRRLLMED